MYKLIKLTLLYLEAGLEYDVEGMLYRIYIVTRSSVDEGKVDTNGGKNKHD